MRRYDLNEDGVYDPNVDDPVMPEDYPDFWHHHLKFVGKELDDEGNVRTWIRAGINPPIQEVGHLFESVMSIGSDGKQFLRAIGTRGSFLPVSFLENMANYDTFRMSKIEPEEPGERTSFTRGSPYRNSPQWMKDFVGYELHPDGSETADPRFSWLLGELPTSRFTNIARQIYDSENPDELNYNALSKAVLAWSTYRYDQETQQYFQNEARIEAMESVLMNIGMLKKYENRAYVDPDTGRPPESNPRRGDHPSYSEYMEEFHRRTGQTTNRRNE